MSGRSLSASAAALAVLAIGTPARADRNGRARVAAECRSAYESATEQVRHGQLREASQSFQTCAKMQCEAVLRRHCLATYRQLDSADIPTVIPIVKDDAGAERHDVQVTVDDAVLATQLDGVALQVNPGLHEFSFSIDGKVFATERVVVAQGQRNRAIAATFHKPAGSASQASAAVPTSPAQASGNEESAHAPATPPSSTPEGTAPSGVSPWAFATGGAVAGGTVALLVLSGKNDTSNVLTDVSIGVSFGALVVAAWVLLADRLKHDASPPRTASVIDIRPSSSGAEVSFIHAF